MYFVMTKTAPHCVWAKTASRYRSTKIISRLWQDKIEDYLYTTIHLEKEVLLFYI